jgi:signal transduction histidine kinase
MTRSARLEGGLSGTLHSVLLAFARTFRAARALLIVRDAATSKNFLVDVRRNAGAPRGYSMTSSELEAETSGLYLFDAPGDCWYGVQRLRSAVRSVTAIDQSGRVIHGGTIRLPASFELRYPCRRLLGVSLQVESEWQGRLLLLDPDVGGDPDEVVTFAQRIARDIAPAIRQVSVVERLRRGAETIERQRLARELHDGPIQTLHAALLQLQTMGAAGPAGGPPGVCDVGAVEALLRGQIANLRDITRGMRLAAVETDSPHLVRDAAAIVDRYARQHGIEARFVSSIDSVAVPATVSHELLRILHEALINVRKHSHARQALVSLRLTGDRLVLTVEDNGCGFPFEGRRTHRELLASKEGPLVIGERTAALGGDLVVESGRGTGARVEVRVPVSIERPVALFQ